jgi:hypothetical protein
MRLRLGLLRDTATIEREAAKEAAEAAAKKHKHAAPTVKTEAATLAEEAAAKNKDKDAEKPKPAPKPRIRPLSEAKAIDTGANFISEAFLFMVGGGLILFESWRSRRKENTRREDVSDRLAELEEGERAARRALVELERELLRIKATENKTNIKQQRRILPREVWELEEKEEQEDEEKARGWLSRVAAYLSGSKGGDAERSEAASSSNQPDGVNGKQSGAGASSSITDGRPESPSHLPSSVSAALERLNVPSQPPGTSHKEAPTTQTK